MGDRQYEYLIGVLNINRCHEYINRCREYIICIQILTYRQCRPITFSQNAMEPGTAPLETPISEVV